MSRLLPPLLLSLLLLAVWEIACRSLQVPAYFLPPPSAVAVSLVERAPLLAGSALQTFRMALQALLAATLIGGGLALAVSMNRPAERAVRPLAVALQVTPVVAIAPLVVIWSGLDHPDRAVVALAAAVAFFPIFSGVLTGLKSAEPDLERLFDLYGASPLQRLVRLRAPAALPFALEGLRVAAGLAVIGAVVAEFVSGSGATQGLAWRLLEAGNRLRTADMLAALVCLMAMGLALNAGVALLERRCRALLA
ncbi:MAG: ABC transporter permease [Caulobacterales bacterium RIFCSPHIGHO2_01_FULL_70_19]|nr:MAG: ABC transporter permease [Caulobacterales bacterium RIFCSPHIGHO2_01_FULL_70_19]